MPPRPPQESPQDWLARTQSSLEIAQYPYESATIFPEDLCFQAQQAAEKALKAIYVARGAKHRYTHRIGELLADLRDIGISVPEDLACAVDLTRYAVNERYPNIGEYVSRQELEAAIQAARIVVTWAGQQLEALKH